MRILDDLDAAEKAATPGPWNCEDEHNNDECYIDRTGLDYVFPYPDKDSYPGRCSKADGTLIALSRNHLRALIECARTLEWYADENNWNTVLTSLPPKNMMVFDSGKRAREALEKLK